MLNELLKIELEEGYSTVEVDGVTGEDKVFKIEDIEQANWAFRKIRAYKAKIEETNYLADLELQRIIKWRDKENQQAEDSIGYFEYLL
jgi:hypothetical protein